MMKILKELTLSQPRIDGSNVLTLDDPELFDYPIAYMSEPGFWTMSDEEARGCGDYLLKGGFIIFDDFRDDHWYNLEEQMKRVLPEARWVQLDHDAPGVPLVLRDRRTFDLSASYGHAQAGVLRHVRGQRSEEAADGDRRTSTTTSASTGSSRIRASMPVDLSNEAYKFGVNYFIYGLIH